MSEERLQEIKDSFNIKFIEGCRSIGKGITIQHINQELELYNEVIRLKKENEILKQNNINEILKNDLSICAKQYKKSEEKLEKANKKIEKANKKIEKTVEELELWKPKNKVIQLEIELLLNILNGKEGD